MDFETTTRLIWVVYLLGFALLVAPAVIAGHKTGKTWLRNGAIWLAIGAALIVLYRQFG